VKSKPLSSEQLSLPFRKTELLPFAVRPRALANPMTLWRALRRKYAKAVCAEGNAARFAASPDGRRAHRFMDSLVLKSCG
jgi:hypothetical protein